MRTRLLGLHAFLHQSRRAGGSHLKDVDGSATIAAKQMGLFKIQRKAKEPSDYASEETGIAQGPLTKDQARAVEQDEGKLASTEPPEGYFASLKSYLWPAGSSEVPQETPVAEVPAQPEPPKSSFFGLWRGRAAEPVHVEPAEVVEAEPEHSTKLGRCCYCFRRASK